MKKLTNLPHPGNNGLWLADNQSHDLSNELWLVRTRRTVLDGDFWLSASPRQTTDSSYSTTKTEKEKLWNSMIRIRGRGNGLGPWLADNQSHDLNNELWLVGVTMLYDTEWNCWDSTRMEFIFMDNTMELERQREVESRQLQIEWVERLERGRVPLELKPKGEKNRWPLLVKTDRPLCPRCRTAVHDNLHFLCECPVLYNLRNQYLGGHVITINHLGKLAPAALLKFIDASGIFDWLYSRFRLCQTLDLVVVVFSVIFPIILYFISVYLFSIFLFVSTVAFLLRYM